MPASSIAATSPGRFDYQFRVGLWLALLHWQEPGLSVVNEPAGVGEDVEVAFGTVPHRRAVETQVKNIDGALDLEALVAILAHYGGGQAHSCLLDRLLQGGEVLVVTSGSCTNDIVPFCQTPGHPLRAQAVAARDAAKLLDALRSFRVGGRREKLREARQAHLDELLGRLDIPTLQHALQRLTLWERLSPADVEARCQGLVQQVSITSERAATVVMDMAKALSQASGRDCIPDLRVIVEGAGQGRWRAATHVPHPQHAEFVAALKAHNMLILHGPAGSGKSQAGRALLDTLAEEGNGTAVALSVADAQLRLGSGQGKRVLLLDLDALAPADVERLRQLVTPDRRLVAIGVDASWGLHSQTLSPWGAEDLGRLWSALQPAALTAPRKDAVAAAIQDGDLRWPGDVVALASRADTLPDAPAPQDVRRALRDARLDEALSAASHGSADALRRALNLLAGVEFQDIGSQVVERLTPVLLRRVSSDAEALVTMAVHAGGVVAEALADCLDGVLNHHQAVPLRSAFHRASLGPYRSSDAAIERLGRILEQQAEPPPSPLDGEAVARTFGAASATLLAWPQDAGGQWIERPELEDLHAAATADKPTLTALLGPPGSGKSALLARLGTRLRDEGVLLLALKADQLPKSIQSLADLDHSVAAPVPLAEALRRLAADRRVVLLVDQLDALGNLMDQHAGRLSALLGLIGAVRGVPNLQVIVSCRPFEFDHDPRLKGLKPEPVHLTLPPWEAVSSLLEGQGLTPQAWSSETCEVLTTPQHLALFLQHLRQEGLPTFTSYVGMLDGFLDDVLARAHGHRVVEVAERMADVMAVEEELSVPAIRFRHERTEVERLLAEGVLVEAGPGRYAFRHQTIADHLRARAFAGSGASLVRFVQDKDQSLFVRATVRATLAYLRTVDPAGYHRSLRELWRHDGLRDHLRWLLIDLLGAHADPTDEEAGLLLPLMDDDTLRPRVLRAVAGSQGWFGRLRGDLPREMARAPEEAYPTPLLLSQALSFDEDAVLRLVESHWANRPGYEVHVWQVLDGPPAWTSRIINLLAGACIQGRLQHGRYLTRRISSKAADLAPEFLARLLWAELHEVEAVEPEPVPPRPGPDAPPAEGLSWYVLHGNAARRRFERLVDHRADLHGLEEIARRAPEPFLRYLWPWLLAVLGRLQDEEYWLLNRYNTHSGLSFSRDEDDGLADAFVAAVVQLAQQEPAAFLKFAAENENSSLMAVHHVLAQGYRQVADRNPQEVLAYLLEDARRLRIGPVFGDDHADTRALIAAVVPHLGDPDVLRLERAVTEWQKYKACPIDERPADRRNRLKWTREGRLHLLRAFPEERLSVSERRRRQEEERALPNAGLPGVRSSGGWVGAPVGRETLSRMSDTAIIALFNYLHDGMASRWFNRPQGGDIERSGGSVEQSRELAEFLKGDPRRALRLARQFQPGRTERPMAYLLGEMPNADVSVQEAIELVVYLDRHGFCSEDFRHYAARALERAAGKGSGLPPQVCTMLEAWMVDWTPPEHSGRDDDGSAERRRGSVLWSRGSRMRVLPHGNHPMLEALVAGFLHRAPP